jgi:hypothetical protein
MELLILGLSIIQAMAISLGVGSSTLAVINFFYAISDGVISDTERNFMGVTYIVLRVAMSLILGTTLFIAFIGYCITGADYFTGYTTAQAVLTSVLFVNAFLMTVHLMPSTFGPAIQAASWYTLGFLLAIYAQGYTEVNFLVFLFAYATFIFFAISFINSIMAYLKEKREMAIAE